MSEAKIVIHILVDEEFVMLKHANDFDNDLAITTAITQQYDIPLWYTSL